MVRLADLEATDRRGIESKALTSEGMRLGRTDEDAIMTLGPAMNVTLTEEELDRLIDRFGKDAADEWVCTLSLQKKAHGYKYKSDYHAILTWARKDQKKTIPAGMRIAAPEFQPHNTEHYCTCCILDHHWRCDADPLCSLGYEAPCRLFIEGRRK